MDQLLDFAGNHWELVTAFIVVLLLFVANEIREQVYGIPKIAPQKLTHLINHQDAVVVDLRDTDLFKNGHITGAKNIPYKTLNDNLEKLNKLKSAAIILTCSHGQQSGMAGKLLLKQGFERVMILAGGITAWRSDNLPLIKK